MSLMDKVKEAASNQFIEVIEWLDESRDTLLYRFPVYQQEIKNGAQLIVRESQAAVFVFEGQVADVFTPGAAVHPYAAGTWGPESAEALIARHGHTWALNLHT